MNYGGESQWITAVVISVSFGAIFVTELLRPLRARVEPLLQHLVRNFATGGVALAFLTFLQAPLLTPVASWVERNGVGIVNLLDLSAAAGLIVSVVLLDYTLWWWHWLNHRVPVLWRFHLVHHVDRDLDASTALRFHFGELILSIVYRALQIVIIGATPYALWVWQTILFASILFHHGNLRLPLGLERLLVKVIVTPRMHAVHHVAREELTNSNWSSLLSAWDYLHRTFRDIAIADRATEGIGVPAYQQRERVSFRQILTLPFRKQRDDWNETRTREVRAESHTPRPA